MTRVFVALIMICLCLSVSAQAEERTRYDLPGNATLTTGTDTERNIIVLRNDNVSPLVQAIVGKDNHNKDFIPLHNAVPYSAFRQSCGDTRTVSERNNCVGKLISQKKRYDRMQY